MKHTKDALVNIYSNSQTTSELKALELLMSQTILDSIKADVESTLRHDKGYDQKIYVDMVWIDKIPLAHFLHTVKDCNNLIIDSKVEIGDLLIQKTRSLLYSHGNPKVLSSQSLIVQAKVTKQDHVIVPIDSTTSKKVTSTTKELALLQHWPEFNLYETSRSNKPILENVVIDENRPHSFYGGFHTKLKTWSFGRAIKDEPCNLKFYDLLEGLNDHSLGESSLIEGSWPQLIDAIMRTASNRKIPKYLNSALRDRVQTTEASIAGFDMQALMGCFFPRRMAILMIDQVDFEGHDIKSLQSSFTGG